MSTYTPGRTNRPNQHHPGALTAPVVNQRNLEIWHPIRRPLYIWHPILDLFKIWHREVEFLQEKGLTPYFSVSLASSTVFSCEETKYPWPSILSSWTAESLKRIKKKKKEKHTIGCSLPSVE
jgi:hypothetical protein